MTDNHPEPQADSLTRIEDVVKQHNMDWRAVAELARRRDQQDQKKRKKVLRMLAVVRETIPELKDELTAEDLQAVETAVQRISKVVEDLPTEPKMSVRPAAPPGSPT